MVTMAGTIGPATAGFLHNHVSENVGPFPKNIL